MMCAQRNVVGLLLLGLTLSTLFAPCVSRAEGEPKLEILVKKNKMSGKDGSDYDNVSTKLRCEAAVYNREFSKTLEQLTLELYVFGEDVISKNFILLDRASSSTNRLAPGAEWTLEGKSIELQYDSNNVARFGTKFGGYLVVVKDASGRIVASKTTKNSLLKAYPRIEKTNINAGLSL